MSAVEKVCACGAPFTVDTGDVSGRFVDVLVRARRLCDPCAAAERAEQIADDEARERRSAEHQHARNVTASGIPANLGVGADPMPDGPARDAVAAWAQAQGPPILVLTGPVGTGKTTRAAAVFRNRLRKRPGYWRSTGILLSHLSAGFGTQAHGEAVQLLDGRRMIALDDIDKVRPSEYAAERIFAAVDACYVHRTPLVITTNLGMAELAAKWPDPFGVALVDRLKDPGAAAVVRITGPNRRRRPIDPAPNA